MEEEREEKEEEVIIKNEQNSVLQFMVKKNFENSWNTKSFLFPIFFLNQ